MFTRRDEETLKWIIDRVITIRELINWWVNEPQIQMAINHRNHFALGILQLFDDNQQLVGERERERPGAYARREIQVSQNMLVED